MARKRIAHGDRPGEIAVLYRTNAQSRVLEEAFVRGGVPYRVYGGQKFYERKEIKDLISYMRALVNPDDDVSLRRVINEPKRGIGDATVDQLAAYAAENELPLMSAVLDADGAGLSARARKLVGEFGELMVDLTDAMYDQKPGEFVQTLIDRTGYVRALEAVKTPENESRVENIRELQGAVAEFERLNPEGGLSDFLENVALVSDTDSIDEAGGSVTLMTLHSAKGLEFDDVFLPGMEDGIFPLSRAMYDDDQLEEERRLAYVGITRAKKRLFLSHARTRMLYNARSANALSRFVGEIPARLITDGTQRGEQRRVPPPSHARVYGGADRAPSRPQAAGRALGIEGVQKGYGGGGKFVGSQARSVKPISLFRAGDQVIHRSFGRGRVVGVEGEGRGTEGQGRFWRARRAHILGEHCADHQGGVVTGAFAAAGRGRDPAWARGRRTLPLYKRAGSACLSRTHE